MLGSNFKSVGWPACGEIDIMEHIGNIQGKIQSAIHTPSSYGNTQNFGSTNISDVSDSFHLYKLNWTSEKLEFFVDNVLFYTYNPTSKNQNNWPFDKNQFLIMNIAIGGSLGGNIDQIFTSSSMEIDYVRVYQ